MKHEIKTTAHISAVIAKPLRDAIEQMAHESHRNISQMVSLLLEEALAARMEAGKGAE